MKSYQPKDNLETTLKCLRGSYMSKYEIENKEKENSTDKLMQNYKQLECKILGYNWNT